MQPLLDEVRDWPEQDASTEVSKIFEAMIGANVRYDESNEDTTVNTVWDAVRTEIYNRVGIPDRLWDTAHPYEISMYSSS